MHVFQIGQQWDHRRYGYDILLAEAVRQPQMAADKVLFELTPVDDEVYLDDLASHFLGGPRPEAMYPWQIDHEK